MCKFANLHSFVWFVRACAAVFDFFTCVWSADRLSKFFGTTRRQNHVFQLAGPPHSAEIACVYIPQTGDKRCIVHIGTLRIWPIAGAKEVLRGHGFRWFYGRGMNWMLRNSMSKWIISLSLWQTLQDVCKYLQGGREGGSEMWRAEPVSTAQSYRRESRLGLGVISKVSNSMWKKRGKDPLTEASFEAKWDIGRCHVAAAFQQSCDFVLTLTFPHLKTMILQLYSQHHFPRQDFCLRSEFNL